MGAAVRDPGTLQGWPGTTAWSKQTVQSHQLQTHQPLEHVAQTRPWTHSVLWRLHYVRRCSFQHS